MNEEINKSSSDEMVSIQIEESLMRETLMAIDSANFKEDFITISSFIIIMIFIILTGIIGPPISVSNEYEFLISNNSNIFDIPSRFSNIRTFNKFIQLSLILIKKENINLTFIPLDFRYTIQCSKDDILISEFIQPPKQINLSIKNKISNSILLYNDNLINYDTINIQIRIENANYNFLKSKLFISIGTMEHSFFQVYFKSCFLLITFLFLILLYLRLKNLEIKLWHLEQKLTLPLLILLIFYNNPFSIFELFYPSLLLSILNIIFSSLFRSYFSFFILILFDSLRYKNRKTDNYFFLPKILFCILMFLIYSINNILKLFKSNDLNNLETIIYLIYSIWAFISVILSAYQVDITERYKFLIYFISGLITLLILVSIEILMNYYNYFINSSLKFVISLGTENIFTFLMTYFHWPYEVFQDQIYN